MMRERNWLRKFVGEEDGALVTLRQLVDSGRRSFENRVRARAKYCYLGGDDGLCRVLGRYKMYVDTRDVSVSAHLMMDGYWELWLTEILPDFVKAGMTVVDAGANIGYFSILLADLVGNSGAVHAFEPNMEMARRLALSAHVNGFESRMVLYTEALGSAESDDFQLRVPSGYPGGGHIVSGEEAGGHPVTVRRMDSYEALLDADFIKIDVEGAESAIWEGMSGILDRGRPMTVALEFVGFRYEDPLMFLSDIENRGFSISCVTTSSGVVATTKEEILEKSKFEELMLLLRR